MKGYLETATDARAAYSTVITGTVLVQPSRQFQWISATTDTELKDGDRLRTDGGSQAFLRLFDYSTLVVYPNTEVQMVRLASSRFTPRREEVELAVAQGTVHLGVAPPFATEKSVQVTTPDGTLFLQEGSYTISVADGRTQVRVAERGQAEVHVEGDSFGLLSGQRIELGPEGTLGPIEAQKEFVNNGDFGRGLDGWQSGNSPGFKEGADVMGVHAVTVDEGRLAVRFRRVGSKGTHDETYLYQEIGTDITDYTELLLSLEMRLAYQSLSGGGYVGSEYPLLVQVKYRTAKSEDAVVYGFYYQNEANNRTDYGIQMPKNVWVKYTVPVNLLTLNPRPQRISSIQVSASGWDYESLVTNISLAGH